MQSCGRAVTKRNIRGRPANRQDSKDLQQLEFCQTCSAELSENAKLCKSCGRKVIGARQHSTSESDGTKMTDSMSQADDDEADTDSEASDDNSDDDCSSTSLSSADLAAPVFSSGGTPSTSLRYRITNKARVQKDERLNERADSFPKVPSRPMMELDAGSNVWYQAYVLKESKSEVKVRFPAIEPSDEEKVEWVRKGSSRIWRGSYKASQWRHLGKGAWAPRAKPKTAGRRLGARPRRKQNKRQSRAGGENSGYTDNSVQCTRTSQGLDKDDISQQQENEIMSPAKRPKQQQVSKHQHLHQQQQLDQKSCFSHSAVPKSAAGGCVDTAAADSNKDNSSKPLSSEDVHGQFKGSGVQGDQVSAKSNSSDFKGMFFESDHDEEQEGRLADTAEYDPLAKWFEMHFKVLREAGSLASLPYGAPEAGVLPSGFAYDKETKQVLGSASRGKRLLPSSQGHGGQAQPQGVGAVGERYASEMQTAGDAKEGVGGDVPGKKRQMQCEDDRWEERGKLDLAAGSSGHRSRGLRELQGLSMWGWDHADHSPRDFVEFNVNPAKRLRGHTSLPPPNSTASTPTALARNASSPNPSPIATTSAPLYHPDGCSPTNPTPVSEPTASAPPPPLPTKVPSPPPTTISRHHSTNSRHLSSDDPPARPLNSTSRISSNPSNPPNATTQIPATKPPSHAEPAARPRQRKRAIIVSDDDDDLPQPAAPVPTPNLPPPQPSSAPSCPSAPMNPKPRTSSLPPNPKPVTTGSHPSSSYPTKHPPGMGNRPRDSLQPHAGAKRKGVNGSSAPPLKQLQASKARAGAAGAGVSGRQQYAGDANKGTGNGVVSANGKPRNGFSWSGGSTGGPAGQDGGAAGGTGGRLSKTGGVMGKSSTGNGSHLHANGNGASLASAAVAGMKQNGKMGSGNHAVVLHRV